MFQVGALLACLVTLNCSHGVSEAGRPTEWRYVVRVAPAAERLEIEAELSKEGAERLYLAPDAFPFTKDVALEVGGRFVDLERGEYGWLLPDSAPERLRLRWRFELAAAAKELSDDLALRQGSATVAAPAAYLLRPAIDSKAEVRIEFLLPEGLAFATGLFHDRSADEGHVFRIASEYLDAAPRTVFGAKKQSTVAIGGSKITIAALDESLRIPFAALEAWVMRSAKAVTAYFGRFPVAELLIIIRGIDGESSDILATTWGDGGATIDVPLGRATSSRALTSDWVMTHEMTHLALPSLPRAYHWFEEGLATYVEPFARVRSGELGEDHVWREIAREIEQGNPREDDGGLDFSTSRERLYWGGALFLLVADTEISRRTNGEKGLDDALRAVLAKGLDISKRAELADVLAIMDEAVGHKVLAPLHASWGPKAVKFDIEKLLGDLGVKRSGRRTRLVDDAPLSAIRKRITNGKP